MKNEPKTLIKHEDARGILVELFKDKKKGQFYYSVTKPGKIRGNHYHTHKWEIFVVVQGKGKLVIEQIKTKNRKTHYLDEKNIKGTKIVPKHAHAIKNIGKTPMILLVYCSEIYNPKDTDTFFYDLKI